MSQKGKISRERIIEAANRLIYTRGFNQTSFADVAEAVGITKGNLHYHFRSKEDLLDAVVIYRLGIIDSYLAEWERELPDPRDRLKRFARILLNEQADVVRYGCPMGSLNVELGKCQMSLQARAREMFDRYQGWLQQSFEQMGCDNSQSLSMHLLAMTQGAALMSYVYGDENIIQEEYRVIMEWLDTL